MVITDNINSTKPLIKHFKFNSTVAKCLQVFSNSVYGIPYMEKEVFFCKVCKIM